MYERDLLKFLLPGFTFELDDHLAVANWPPGSSTVRDIYTPFASSTPEFGRLELGQTFKPELLEGLFEIAHLIVSKPARRTLSSNYIQNFEEKAA